jgi:CheY-like chemotaxis protein
MAKTVFIIEDDTDIRDSLAELLELEGYQVITASNGHEGLDRLTALGDRLPEVILLDLMMPIKDGFEFRHEQLAHPKWSSIPVIVMSADANVSQKLKSSGFPVPAYLKKPVNLDDILALVAQSLPSASA